MNRPIVVAAVFALSLSLSVVEGRAQDEDRDEAKQVEPEVATRRRVDTRVEEIVVTARKRDELLEDAPVSVTALSAATLREVGATRLDDIQTLVPNLIFATADDGVAADIRIRGIGTPQLVSIAFDPGVGVYVDGVYLPRTIGTLVDVIDMQQVEVLRGPQGTLFGKNTVGGAINITTAKPSPELEGFALVRPGNLWSVHTRGMLNIPVTVSVARGPSRRRAVAAVNACSCRRLHWVCSIRASTTLAGTRDPFATPPTWSSWWMSRVTGCGETLPGTRERWVCSTTPFSSSSVLGGSNSRASGSTST